MSVLKIVRSATASARVNFAVDELSFFLKEAGVKFHSVTDKCFLAPPFISVGENKYSEGVFPKDLLSQVGEDGYQIISHPDCTYILGGRDNGTVFGVYGFLKEYLGLEIFSDTLFTIEKKPLKLKEKVITDKPDIPMRTIGAGEVHFERRAGGTGNTRYRMRMKLRYMDEGWGINNHTYFRVLPPAKYRKAHPDWYDKTGVNLCLTNEAMRAEFVANMKKIIENSSKDERLFMFGMEDTIVHCDCPACTAKMKELGGFTGVMLDFTIKAINELNAWLKEVHPERDIIFFTFAYAWEIAPPVVKLPDGAFKPKYPQLKMPENFGVLLAPLLSSANYPMRDPRNYVVLKPEFFGDAKISLKDVFEGWRSLVNYIAVWNYNANFYDYLTPMPSWTGMKDNYEWFKEFNAVHVFTEAGCGLMSNFCEMKIYCASQFMWGTPLSQEEVIKKFMSVAFKGADDEVYGYFTYIHEYAEYLLKEKNRPIIFAHFDDDTCQRWLDARFWPKDVLEKCLGYFDRALARKLDPEVAVRVAVEALPAQFTYLELYRKEIDKTKARSIIKRMKKTLEDSGITDYACNVKPNKTSEYLKQWTDELKSKS